MSGESDLATLMATMSPQHRPGRFVFATVDTVPVDAEIFASVLEAEGLSVLVAEDDARRLGLPYSFVAGWITLQVHSALDAVGLTAAVSTALATAEISCNVIAGNYHDHLLVPIDRLDDALGVLRELTA
ncbi:ACT domain-containing protein [Spelaeicoccus albus]|uniref:DUF2241 domain-containing protein n=1 Tax=Spelaeicoccus albus TaxID=1280376 RepID=A0A7Z0IHC2_9MICO|nr:ACT domain-containing protein [Spelaeicoccus albus]NYI67566.1 hypothetical protein [Spelaeicoccus albus]